MTLTSTLSSALSGLTATSRAAKVVSSNLSNALNENYGRRDIQLEASGHMASGGVRVVGVARNVDPVLLSDKRSASAGLARATEKESALETIERVIGNVNDEFSLSGHLRALDNALTFAESNPASQARHLDVVNQADATARAFNAAENEIRNLRERADAGIANAVGTLNVALKQVEELNERIVSATINGHETAGYEDQRQALVDTISALVPVKELSRRYGAVSLVTNGGLFLLEQRAVELDFTSSATIMPHMTNANGQLDDIDISGYDQSFSTKNDGLSGGKLQGLFETRDQFAVDAQSKLDSLAYELSSRFQETAVDPTLGPTDAGLFTDTDLRVELSNLVGLSGRISINQRVDPSRGGDEWRIRDGMLATGPGSVGNSSIISQMKSALRSEIVPSAPGLSQSGSLLDLATQFGSETATEYLFSQSQLTNFSNQNAQMQELMFAQGVDTDSELQKLLLIETNYAANAKVIETVENMLDTLMRIG